MTLKGTENYITESEFKTLDSSLKAHAQSISYYFTRK